MRKIINRALAVAMILLLFTGCGAFGQNLNGVSLDKYTIVYSNNAPDYCQRAAEYIQSQILTRTGVEVPVCEAATGTYDHEILVGDTNRDISRQISNCTEDMQFGICAADGHIALNAQYYVIAAAAYYFVETYIPGDKFQSQIPTEISLNDPITCDPNNFIFLIGDGMGFNQTLLFEDYDIETDLPNTEFHDGEDEFYGYHFPYQGQARTNSLSGTTDSAAGGTALATGYKTINGYVGKDSELSDLTSLTELAASLGKATAVLSTDDRTGATPASFSAHADSREDTTTITESQNQTILTLGTIIEGSLHVAYDYQDIITDTLSKLDADPDGFFMMYEEGHIDKFSHNMNIEGTFESVVRFNQAIGLFMEYAFYNPDTFVVITADHETGGLMTQDGMYQYTTNSHTPADVPVFAYGAGADIFDNFSDENTMIPKYVAKLMGVENFGS